MSELKFCKDCKFCKPTVIKTGTGLFGFGHSVYKDFSIAHCERPEVQQDKSLQGLQSFTDFLVTGKGGHFCTIARQKDKACGTDAKYYEAAE